MMRFKNLFSIIFLLLVCSSHQSFGVEGDDLKARVVTSITPVASIVHALLGDEVNIDVIANNSSCPHHHHSKPSDLKKILNANIIIYINQAFDSFAAKLSLKNDSAKIIQLSNISGIKLRQNKNLNINWHFWLDLDNVLIIGDYLSVVFKEMYPFWAQTIENNLMQFHHQIEGLRQIKHDKLEKLNDVILLSDSLEYFFVDDKKQSKYKIFKLYDSSNKSLKYLDVLENIVNQSRDKCLILSAEQDDKFYQSFNNVKIIKLQSENWRSKNLKNLFYNNYLKMISIVSNCVVDLSLTK